MQRLILTTAFAEDITYYVDASRRFGAADCDEPTYDRSRSPLALVIDHAVNAGTGCGPRRINGFAACRPVVGLDHTASRVALARLSAAPSWPGAGWNGSHSSGRR